MQAAGAQNDFITPAVVSAAEADYERNLATPSSCSPSLVRSTYGTQNVALFNKWLPNTRSSHLMPPIVCNRSGRNRASGRAYGDALGHAKNRIKGIATELGLKVPANLAS